MSEKNPQFDDKPPAYAPPPYTSLGDPAVHPQYPPPGQGFSWQQPPPVTEAPVQGGYTPQPGYPAQPPYQHQPGYQQQPGYPPQPGSNYPPQPGYPGYPAQPSYQVGGITQQHNVTVVQAGGPSVIVAPQIVPPDYCCLAWFACLCCFWPSGICAILKSNETRAAIFRGDLVSANQLSMETRKLANMTIGIGIALYVVIVVLRIVLTAATN